MLIYSDRRRKLYGNIDVNKLFGIGYMFYYIKAGVKFDNYEYLIYDLIETILFFSRKLNDAEKRYWPTKLKIASLIWFL